MKTYYYDSIGLLKAITAKRTALPGMYTSRRSVHKYTRPVTQGVNASSPSEHSTKYSHNTLSSASGYPFLGSLRP